MAAEIARCHHERCDGTGYPIGLKGNDIPLAARIVSVADVFDALTMKRVYKDAIDVIEARDYIAQRGETQFDPDVVKAFVNRFEEIVEIKRAIDSNSSSLSILKEAEILSESVERCLSASASDDGRRESASTSHPAKSCGDPASQKHRPVPCYGSVGSTMKGPKPRSTGQMIMVQHLLQHSSLLQPEFAVAGQ